VVAPNARSAPMGGETSTRGVPYTLVLDTLALDALVLEDRQHGRTRIS
jgi:hypothetical protein